jgi:hypothetical protein
MDQAMNAIQVLQTPGGPQNWKPFETASTAVTASDYESLLVSGGGGTLHTSLAAVAGTFSLLETSGRDTAMLILVQNSSADGPWQRAIGVYSSATHLGVYLADTNRCIALDAASNSLYDTLEKILGGGTSAAAVYKTISINLIEVKKEPVVAATAVVPDVVIETTPKADKTATVVVAVPDAPKKKVIRKRPATAAAAATGETEIVVASAAAEEPVAKKQTA